VITLGIDLASQAAGTAYCVVRWTDRGVQIEAPRVGCDDDDLVAAMLSADAIGIDAPFGWPDGFVAAVAGWHHDDRWRADGDLRLRQTDHEVARITREITGRAAWPLSVSSDRIGIVAWRCAALLQRHHELTGAPMDRSGGSGVYEVYPAAALAVWGCVSRGYKPSGAAARTPGRTARREILGQMSAAAPWLAAAIGSADADALVASGDGFDAFISALIARAAATRRTYPPTPEQRDAARTEGWIHVPEPDALVGL
jgi:predicted nuclease with RNAse H fold